MFTVEQGVRGKWACRRCEILIQAPVPAQVIDKGIPTVGLRAHVGRSSALVPVRENLRPCRLGYSTLDAGQRGGQTGVQLHPLVNALREVVRAEGIIRTPI